MLTLYQTLVWCFEMTFKTQRKGEHNTMATKGSLIKLIKKYRDKAVEADNQHEKRIYWQIAFDFLEDLRENLRGAQK